MDIGGQRIKFRIDQNAITIGSFKENYIKRGLQKRALCRSPLSFEN